MTAAPAARAPQPPQALDDLSKHLFCSMGVDGLHARTGLYEGVVDALSRLIDGCREPQAEVLRFPPVMSRKVIEASGYLKSFPNLLGCLCCLKGDEAEIGRTVSRFAEGRGWTDDLAAADLVLTPASCYPVYPIAAERGETPADGLLFDVACDCFRREPSKDLDRLQSFRMREFVRVGSAEQALAFRAEWIERARDLARRLKLPHEVEVASDPFFGRGGRLLAASQIEQTLKFELLVPILSVHKPTACMSFNYHQDHFGEIFGLRRPEGDNAHTACVAFGMDRLAVALFAVHGVAIAAWPDPVRQALGL